jgi:hypothetical protein
MRRLSVALLAACAVAAATRTSSADSHRRYALVFYNEAPAFEAEAKAFTVAMAKRGYLSQVVDAQAAARQHENVHNLIAAYLQGTTTTVPGATWASSPARTPLVQGDELVLSFQCDGALNVGVYLDPTTRVNRQGFQVDKGGQQMANHDACWITSGQISALATLAERRGINLVVIDGSCSGGATTFLLERRGVCSLAEAPPGFPAVQGDPALSQYLDSKRYPFIRTFSDLAAAGGLTILAQMPQREQQDGFYSAGGVAASAMTLRAAIYGVDQSLGAWDLGATDVYPYFYAYLKAHPTRVTMGYLGGDKIPPTPTNPLDLLLRRATNYETIMREEMQRTNAVWQAEDAMLRNDPQSPEAQKKARLYGQFRGTAFVTNPIEFTATGGRGPLLALSGRQMVPLLRKNGVPATIPDAHVAVRRMISILMADHAPLAAALQDLEREVHSGRGSADQPSPEELVTLERIAMLEARNRDVLPRLSKVLGLLDLVEARATTSPCDKPI